MRNKFEPLVDWKDDLLCGGGYVVVMALIIWLSGGLK